MERTRLRPRSAEAGDGEAARGLAVPSRPPKEPSWLRVYLTTARVFLERRLRIRLRRRGPYSTPAARPAPVVLGALAAGLLLVGGGLYLLTTGGGAKAQARPAADPGALAAAARYEAAIWLAAEVGQDHHVACAMAVCEALGATGFPVASLVPVDTLTVPSTSPAPGGKPKPAARPGGPAPLFGAADVVALDAAVRARLGDAAVANLCPERLAVFGGGAQQVEIHRAASPVTGPAGCQLSLVDDQTARIRVGQRLLRDAGLGLTPAAQAPLASGSVDSRLLTALNAYTANHRLSVDGFADSGPGASPQTPLRTVVIAGIDGTAPDPRDPHTSLLTTFLNAQRPPYRPLAITQSTTPDGPRLSITYAAPGPLGLLGG